MRRRELFKAAAVGALAVAAPRIGRAERINKLVFVPTEDLRLPNYCGKAADTGGADRHGAGFELVVGDGGALDSAPNQVATQTIGQVATIEPV